MPAWMRRALCAAFPTLPWIAEPQQTSSKALEAMGLVCGICPVQVECRAFVEHTSVTSGFWAGADRSEPGRPVDEDGAA